MMIMCLKVQIGYFYSVIIRNFAVCFPKGIMSIFNRLRSEEPSIVVSLVPIVVLLVGLAVMIAHSGADAAQQWGPMMLATAAAVCVLLTVVFTKRSAHDMWVGLRRSATQLLPAMPILVLIGTLSATWMLSGVVPAMIDYGLAVLSPNAFLVTTCAVCAAVSVLSGSSWTTIATIGVAFMGVGTVMGYSAGWTAGAIISGAYFGDKMSPLSDTTVLASSSCGVGLFSHIRNMMYTSMPALAIAMVVYGIAGFCVDAVGADADATEMIHVIERTFNITPWLMIIPAVTCMMLALKMGTVKTLTAGTFAGLIGMWVFQPELMDSLGGGDFGSDVWLSVKVLLTSTEPSTGNEILDSLAATGGVAGMLPTVLLVFCAMLFGGAMIGSGMLAVIARKITARLHSVQSLVGATVCSGLCLNMLTGDQYLSIIIGGNIYSDPYQRVGADKKVLSRALEDSVSVTSVLIPWNSCGLTQSTVLGVATLTYLPYCVFNILSPLMSIVAIWSVRLLASKRVALRKR